MDDKLIFSAGWAGGPLTAQEAAAVMRTVLERLEHVSPWGRQIDVSGLTAKQSHLRIAEDFSDFEAKVFAAMQNKDVRYFSEAQPAEKAIVPDSKSVFGFHATFSDYPAKTAKTKAVTVEMITGSSDGSCPSGVTISVPRYYPVDEENAVWSSLEPKNVPRAVFDLLMDQFDPLFCSVHASSFKNELCEWGKDINSPIGIFNYVAAPKVVAALASLPDVRRLRNGIIFQLAQSPIAFADPVERDRLMQDAAVVRDLLRAANATDWMDPAA